MTSESGNPEPAADSSAVQPTVAAPPDLKAAPPDTAWLQTESLRASAPPPNREGERIERVVFRDEQ